MSFKIDEMETGLLWNATTRKWDVITNVPHHIRLFQRIAVAHDVEPELSPEGRLRVVLPEKAVSFRRPATREISAEQREGFRQRMLAVREQRKARDDETQP